MADEMMSLRGLLEKSADADVLREMIGNVPPAEAEAAFYAALESTPMAA